MGKINGYVPARTTCFVVLMMLMAGTVTISMFCILLSSNDGKKLSPNLPHDCEKRMPEFAHFLGPAAVPGREMGKSEYVVCCDGCRDGIDQWDSGSTDDEIGWFDANAYSEEIEQKIASMRMDDEWFDANAYNKESGQDIADVQVDDEWFDANAYNEESGQDIADVRMDGTVKDGQEERMDDTEKDGVKTEQEMKDVEEMTDDGIEWFDANAYNEESGQDIADVRVDGTEKNEVKTEQEVKENEVQTENVKEMKEKEMQTENVKETKENEMQTENVKEMRESGVQTEKEMKECEAQTEDIKEMKENGMQTEKETKENEVQTENVKEKYIPRHTQRPAIPIPSRRTGTKGNDTDSTFYRSKKYFEDMHGDIPSDAQTTYDKLRRTDCRFVNVRDLRMIFDDQP